MDTHDNTDALLNAYAGQQFQTKEQKNQKHMMFYQKTILDVDEQAAVLKILNLSRPKGILKVKSQPGMISNIPVAPIMDQ